jgi:acyl-CoA thioesterase-2
MPGDIAKLFELEQVDQQLFQTEQHKENFRETLFGGQVLGQAIKAAMLTATHLSPHSLHAYFLRPGHSRSPIKYEVENVRDGGSFSNRRVVAKQDDKVIFHLSASFQKSEAGFQHQALIPANTPSPEECKQYSSIESDPHTKETLAPNSKTDKSGQTQIAVRSGPFEIYPCDDTSIYSTDEQKPEIKFWFKYKSEQRMSAMDKLALLAYASDFGLLATAVLPHPTNLFKGEIIAASIDHAMWFHRTDFESDEWFLYCVDSPWAGNARGFSNGKIYTQDGKLVASTSQEGLIRQIGDNKAS